MSILSLHNISKSFGDEVVLNNISLDVAAGSFITLLGPSGCGKTTLLRIIAGLERPDLGEIHAKKMTFVNVARNVFLPPQKRKLGFVFQDYGLWPHMTVAENVAFPLKMAKASPQDVKKRVGEVLDAVRLAQHADKLPEKLSGGQKQRVSIARALAAKPDLILFDEPLSNLDANLREDLGRDIQVLSKQLGLTCINVTHDRREAQILSDQIALMKDGVIHQLGQPHDLFRNPRDVWAARFLDVGNILPVGIIQIDVPEHFVMVPRKAFRLVEADQGLSATATNCMFIEDRFEVTADLQGHEVKLFSNQPIGQEQSIGLKVDLADILPLSHGAC
ncbi:MAG: ABC transporter ATP-binding protein [Magnetovibrio sp.]|nr:ABC transporter ATP-binding protein [Magnetovibrio sp.]